MLVDATFATMTRTRQRLALAYVGSASRTFIIWAGYVRTKGRGMGARIVEALDARAGARAAAAIHEQLSTLSEAELRRRGIRRAELHRRAFEPDRDWPATPPCDGAP
jgi:hypothetical protein